MSCVGPLNRALLVLQSTLVVCFSVSSAELETEVKGSVAPGLVHHGGLRKIATEKESLRGEASSEPSEARSVVPSAAQLGEVFVGATKKSTNTEISTKADVMLSVLKYNEQAIVYGSFFRR